MCVHVCVRAHVGTHAHLLRCAQERAKAIREDYNWCKFYIIQFWEILQGCIAEQRIEHTCTHAHHQKHHGKHISMDMDPHQFVDVQRNTDSHCAHQQEQGPTPSPDPPPDTAAAGSEPQKKLGRNTWPRKKVRQVAHVASLFDRDGDDQDDDGSDLGPIMVESGSNYFVSADDSVCDGGRLAEEYSLSRMGNVQRIPRNSKMPLPPGEERQVGVKGFIC